MGVRTVLSEIHVGSIIIIQTLDYQLSRLAVGRFLLVRRMYEPGSWHTFWKRRLHTPFIVIIMVKFKLGWKLRDFGGECGEQHTNIPPYRVKPHPIEFSVTPTNIEQELETMISQKFGGCAAMF